MTASTETERAEYVDGAWYWVEKEGWIGDPPTIAPAKYKANCDAWYSFEFSGIPTREVKVLEPCVRHEQAARRAPVVPQAEIEPIETVKYWRDAYANPKGDEHFMGHGMVVKIFDDYLALLAAAPQPPEAERRVCNNDECGWIGQIDETVHPKHDASTLLCPECHETTELAMAAVAAPVQLPEPDSYLFQHEETGLTQYVEAQQVEWGFEKNNPRWKRVSEAYSAQKVRQLLAAQGNSHG
jgi:hypothetical protein